MNPLVEQTPATQFSIRACTTAEEIRECVNLQHAIWQDPDRDLTPSAIFIVAAKTGGHALLARSDGRPAGFALAFAAFHGEQRYLHSHIVGVLPEFQSRGLGRLLKLKQRELALARGVSLIEWTFDPLELRNAYFNVARLGAIIRRFCPNLYGVTDSPLHNRLPTDRLVAEWQLDSARVHSAIRQLPAAPISSAKRIVVPADIQAWKRSAPERVRAFQAELQAMFEESFASGLAVTGFSMVEGSGIYHLDPYEN